MYGLLLKGVESLKVIVVSHKLIEGTLFNKASILHHQDFIKLCKLKYKAIIFLISCRIL